MEMRSFHPTPEGSFLIRLGCPGIFRQNRDTFTHLSVLAGLLEIVIVGVPISPAHLGD